MTGRPTLLRAFLWLLLVVSLAFLARPLGDAYRRPIAAAGEALARLAAPADVRLDVSLEKGRGEAPRTEKMRFAASRAGRGISTALDTHLLDVSAAMLLATAILTPLGGPAKRVLWVFLAFLGFILVMGVLAAGLALVPLVQGGFVESRLAWRMAALSQNVSTSGLIMSFPAAIWFLSTLRWWRRGPAAGEEREDGREPGGAAGGKRRKGKRR